MDRKAPNEGKSPAGAHPAYLAASQKANNLFHSPDIGAFSSSVKSHNSFELSPKLRENNVIYDEAIIERKQASFENLKKWDNHRSHLLHMHGKVVDALLSKMEQKIESSNNFMHKVVKFFKEKVSQETEYMNVLRDRLPKFTKLFPEPSPSEKTPSSLFKSFQELDEMHGKKAQQLQTYVDYLEKTILKEILQKETLEFTRKVSLFRERIQDLKKSLSRSNVETGEKSTKYSKTFYEMTEPQSANKPKKSPKDLYNLELGFLRIAEEQSQIQRDLGNETVGFWREVIRLEANRLHTIQKVMLNYLIQSESLKGSAKNEFQSLDPEKEAEGRYSLGEMLSREELSMIEKLRDGVVEISLEDCFTYLKTVEVERFRENHLILKEICLEREHSSNDFRACLVVFTIDNSMLIFDEPKQGYFPASFCLRIEGIKVLPREEERMAEISAKVAGFLFDSKNRFVFRFENNDKVEEFINYFNFVNLKKG